MPLSAASIANRSAWVVILALAGSAVAIAARYGCLWLMVLGAAAWLVCVLAELDHDVPTSGAQVFRARMERRGSAADETERREALSPLRFFARCGMALFAAGTLGLVVEIWRG